MLLNYHTMSHIFFICDEQTYGWRHLMGGTEGLDNFAAAGNRRRRRTWNHWLEVNGRATKVNENSNGASLISYCVKLISYLRWTDLRQRTICWGEREASVTLRQQATAPFKWQVWHRYTVEVNFSKHHFIPACHHIMTNLFVLTMDRIAGGWAEGPTTV